MADQQPTGAVHGSGGLCPRWTLPLHAHHFTTQTYHTPQTLWRPSTPLRATTASPVFFASSPSENNIKNKKSFAADLLLGGVSSSVSKTLAAPVERVKMLLQNQDAIIRAGRLAEPYRGIGDCFARTIRDEGFLSLWRGNTTNIIRYFPTQVHLSAPNVDQFVNLLLAIPAQGYGNSLAYIMSEWSQLQGEIQGAYQIKVTTTALALLISTRHPELSRIEVNGHLVKTTAGITTRSKARVAPDHWTKIPLPSKIFSLLADTLAEIQEQVGDDADNVCEEDSDWEEVQNGDAVTHDMIYAASVPSNANPSVEHLNAMAKVFDEDEDDSYDDDLAKTDSLNEVKLLDFLTSTFVNLWDSDRPLFEYLLQGLTSPQRVAIEKVLRK